MFVYDQYYRKFGVRLPGHLMSPPMFKIERLELPKESIFHYQGDSIGDVVPKIDDFLLRKVPRIIPVMHFTEMKSKIGQPRPVTTVIDNLIRKYHSENNHRYRRVRVAKDGLKDPLAPLVCNYGWLWNRFKYNRSLYSEYYRWKNVAETIWSDVSDLLKESQRQNFLIVKLPEVLPSLSQFRQAAKTFNTSTLKIFHDHESLFIFELWKWISEYRGETLIDHATENKQSLLEKINLVFIDTGTCMILNLGKLNAWRDGSEVNGKIVKGLRPKDYGIRFLHMLMNFLKVRKDGIPDEQEVIVDAAEAKLTLKVNVQTDEDEETENIKAGLSAVAYKGSEKITVIDPNQSQTKNEKEVEKITLDALVADEASLKKLEEDLDGLDQIRQLVAGIGSTKPGEVAAELPLPAEIHKGIDVERPTKPSRDVNDPLHGVESTCKRLVQEGMLTGGELNYYMKAAESYKSIKALNGSNETLETFVDVPKEMVEIKEPPQLRKPVYGIHDKNMTGATLNKIDSDYIKNVYHRDVAAMILKIQSGGYCLTDLEKTVEQNIAGAYEDYRITIEPVEGQKTTLRAKMPKLREDGTYRINGVKYTMRRQRGDLPIRKVKPFKVCLTSYYGKNEVIRSSKRVNDYSAWLVNKIIAAGLDSENTIIQNVHPGSVFDHSFSCPRLYSSIAMRLSSFTMNGFVLNFDHTKREALYGAKILQKFEKDGSIVIGMNDHGFYMITNREGKLFLGRNTSDEIKELDGFEKYLGLNRTDAPVDFANLKIFAKEIPLCLALSYRNGFHDMLQKINTEIRRVPTGSRLSLRDNEVPIVFNDETIIFNRDDDKAAMILGGFREVHKTIKNYSVYDMDNKDVYLPILEAMGISIRYLREIDMFFNYFIDPITLRELEEMKEPTDVEGLLYRSCELLVNDQHPSEIDSAYMRDRRYERLAGAMYKELINTVRTHEGRPGKGRYRLEMNPYAVWTAISEDGAIQPVNDINPIQHLKESEAVTFSGAGGRSSRSMTAPTRQMTNSDRGVISESSVDSGDVGINIFTSANPQYNSMRGTSNRYQKDETTAANMLSTSCLLAVGSLRDDPKRMMFTAIQASHAVACPAYKVPPLTTGYEKLIAQRTGELFAYAAKDDGIVEEIGEKGVRIKYADGSIVGLPLGRQYGAAAGLTIPHTLVHHNLKPGMKFKKGYVLTYNTGYFEPDPDNDWNVIWKSATVVTVALYESNMTFEDSSAISKSFAEQMTTTVTKEKNIILRFDQHLRKLVKVGDTVKTTDILCYIEDAITADNDLLDDEAIDTLRLVSSNAPRAKAHGVVERIEVYYNGEIQDMSESLKTLAKASDKQFAAEQKLKNEPVLTGQVDEGFRIDGNPLMLDTAVVRIYITSNVPMGIGDKGVFGHQLKSVIGEVWSGDVVTESGIVLDAAYGRRSVMARIVNSADIMLTTIPLLEIGAREALKIYRGKK